MSSYIHEVAYKNHYKQLTNDSFFKKAMDELASLNRPPTDEEYISIIASCCRLIESYKKDAINYAMSADNHQGYNW